MVLFPRHGRLPSQAGAHGTVSQSPEPVPVLTGDEKTVRLTDRNSESKSGPRSLCPEPDSGVCCYLQSPWGDGQAMPEDDYRKKAEECRAMAARAVSTIDKEAWLKLAEDWLRMAESRESIARKRF